LQKILLWLVQSEVKSIQQKIALVLTDLENPEMDGFTLTRNIKDDCRFDGIPVVIHSSLAAATNENNVKQVGADAYVATFKSREIAATIRRFLPQV
jgi:two-component system, chemotaxis family, chemotaxis protein CheV